MEKSIFIFLIISILSCSTNKEIDNFIEEEKTISYVDSVPGFSFQKTNKSQTVSLIFLKQFKDSLEIYLNKNRVEKFYKNDFHYDNEGNEYIVHDEATKLEIKIVCLERKSKNYITIASKSSKKKVSFEINKDYDNYLVSRFNNHWYFTGIISK